MVAQRCFLSTITRKKRWQELLAVEEEGFAFFFSDAHADIVAAGLTLVHNLWDAWTDAHSLSFVPDNFRIVIKERRKKKKMR